MGFPHLCYIVYPWLTNTSIVWRLWDHRGVSESGQCPHFGTTGVAGFPVFCLNLWISLDKSCLGVFGWFWTVLDRFGRSWFYYMVYILIYIYIYLLNGKQTNPTRDIDRPKLKNMSGHTGFGQRSKCVRPRIG